MAVSRPIMCYKSHVVHHFLRVTGRRITLTFFGTICSHRKTKTEFALITGIVGLNWPFFSSTKRTKDKCKNCAAISFSCLKFRGIFSSVKMRHCSKTDGHEINFNWASVLPFFRWGRVFPCVPLDIFKEILNLSFFLWQRWSMFTIVVGCRWSIVSSLFYGGVKKQIKSSSSLLLSAVLVSNADWRRIFKRAIFNNNNNKKKGHKNEFEFQSHENRGGHLTIFTILFPSSAFCLCRTHTTFWGGYFEKRALCITVASVFTPTGGVMVCWIVRPLRAMTTPKSSSSVSLHIIFFSTVICDSLRVL